MLVLTRKIGERIHIGTDIIITVVKVEGQRTRLGIEAPSSTPILREELQAVRQSWLEPTAHEVADEPRMASRRARS
jgi:carbon storage regulator